MNHSMMLRTVLILSGAFLLALVFRAYLQPGFLIDIATRLLLCL